MKRRRIFNLWEDGEIIIDEAETDESGFQESASSLYRLINKDGSFNISRKGLTTSNWYERFISMSWMRFILFFLMWYFLINGVFAIGFMAIGPEYITGMDESSKWGTFIQCLYFSIQTFTTVGYGYMSPIGTKANLLASFVAFTGLLSFALITGLSFAKFSKPQAHILFSKKLLIAPNKDGNKSLQFRIVNGANNTLIDMAARVTLAWVEEVDGVMRRKFARLDLELDNIHLFPLNWTLVHLIDKKSPLYGLSKKDMHESQMEILVLIKGFDDMYTQFIHSKHSYSCAELVDGARFKAMYISRGDKTVLDVSKLNDIEPYKFNNHE